MRILAAGLMMLLFACGVNEPHPEAMKLFLPKDADTLKSTPADKNKTLTLVLVNSETIYYYTGELKQMEKTSYKGIRDIIAQKKKEWGNALTVIIKPSKEATYKNTVDALDEMFIGDIKSYALVDISKEDIEYLEKQTAKD